MNQYNPFKGEENPFDEEVNSEVNSNNVQKRSNTFNNRKITNYSFLILIAIVISTAIYSLGNLSNSKIESDFSDTPLVEIEESSKLETSSIPDEPVDKEVENISVEKANENISVIEPIENVTKQNKIITKTVQVIAEECTSETGNNEKDTAVGSGVLISSDGLIISNQHIIENCYGDIFIATTNDVDTPTEIKYFAEVIQESLELDLVLLKITSSIDNTPLDNTFEYFELSGTDELVLGDGLEIWGFPTARGDGTTYSLKINLTKGTVSGFESDYQIKRGWIVTDADVTYGNSGGAALDKLGRLVGIPTFGTTEGASWISYLRSVDVIEAWLSETSSSTLLTNFSFPQLTIREHSISNIPKYSREDWNSWIDGDLDCQNTRHENLQLESFVNVLFTKSDNCYVQSGKWFDPYNGEFFYFASNLDIDHFIPLYNAHLSGGWKWDVNKKTDFANSLLDPDILIAVKNSTNREKGASAPDKWKPQNMKYWCEYAFDWIRIKHEWGLTATLSEWNSLLEMIDTCPNSFTYDDAKNSDHKMSIEKVLKYEQ
jgi:S1-C subfamily serine protease